VVVTSIIWYSNFREGLKTSDSLNLIEILVWSNSSTDADKVLSGKGQSGTK
jgi:hypothetical protein